MKRLQMLTVVVTFLGSSVALGQQIGFIEDFSLAKDRTVPLKQLIPGTEDYYYYHALHYQNTEQYDKVDETLAAWIKRYKYTPRVREIQNRQALLTYEKHPEQTLEHIRKQLNLHFNHQRETLGKKPNLPTTLNPKTISHATLYDRAMRNYKNLQGFEDSALDWLTTKDLNPDRRRHLLERLQRPDYPNLVKLVVDDLNHKYSRGFGSFAIHRQLLTDQLEQCVKLKGDLLNQTHFVNTYLTKLHPSDDVDWQNSAEQKQAYLDRLWNFAQRLAPVHNSLKAHVLYHRLVFDRTRGIHNRDRFMTYIKLPRNVSYIEPKYMQLDQNRRSPANLAMNFQPVTLLPIVGNDEPLVRSYLHHFFLDEPNFDVYKPYISDLYLKHNFAEAKIVAGLGEGEQWYSMLPPAQYQALKERIDLDFAPTNKQIVQGDEAVSLDLYVKNVKQLIVKVYQINTRNYYRDKRREVNTSVNLDGLVANEEITHTYQEPALRRVCRHFEFAKLKKPGVYVIDFIGNGKSSRVVIRKGRLRYLAQTTSAGHRFVVLDEQNQKLEDATIWIDGHEYKAGTNGMILVPFSNRPGRQAIILSHGDFTSLDYFGHESENYGLAAGIYVDREALLTRQKAQVIVRPQLQLNSLPSSLSVLEQVQLVITSTDLDGVSTSKEVAGFELHDDKESAYEFQVPQRLAQITFSLKAKVKNLSQGKTLDLAASESFTVNQIDRTEKVEDLHLANYDGTHVVQLLGKTGEVRVDRPVQFVLKHRDYRNTVNLTLQTNDLGRITLGALQDIQYVKATGPEGTSHTWNLRNDQHSYHASVHGKAGESVYVPYLGSAAKPEHSELSLLEVRGNSFIADRFGALKIDGSLLSIGDLPRGDYDLLLKRTGRRIRIRLAEGERRGSYVLGDYRQLEVRGRYPLQISQVTPREKMIRVALQNATETSRLHVLATRYQPAFDVYAHIGRIGDPEPFEMRIPKLKSHYVTGRNIGDEYRYIIDRKYAKKRPGNMLTRPSLLLNPWAIRSTETGRQLAEGGGKFGSSRPSGGTDGKRGAPKKQGVSGRADFSNLNYLSSTSAVLLNLVPDEKGMVTIDREQLGDRQQLHLVAVDRSETAYRVVTLPEQKTEFRDLRLANALDPEKHFTEQKQISVVKADQKLEIADITTAKFEVYDSLPRVYSLYATLSGNSNLLKFSFILNWHKMKPEEKREKYSEFACHELNFFLYKKDKEFFQAVVQPYLANKLDRTFMDQWLLNEELTEYLEPWRHEQLNVVEKILLSQRIKGEATYTSRHLIDLFDLLPPNIDRYNHLFDTAAKGSALETGDRLGLATATDAAELTIRMKQLQQLDRQVRSSMAPGEDDAPAPPAPEAAPASRPSRDLFRDAAKEKAGKKSAETKSEARRELPQRANRAKDEDANGLFEEMEQADVKKNRQSMRQFYRKLDKTQEWVENNYYQLAIAQQNAQLITTSAFWKDYAEHDARQPFYSTNLAEASRNFSEMMFALALLDLPVDSKKPKTEFAGAKMTYTAASPAIVYHQEIKVAQAADEKTSILVSENFFRHGDRYRHVNNQRLDKFVSEEFLVHAVYGCQVVVTNPTSSPQKLNVLLQVPLGAIPVLGGKYTRTMHVDLAPYNTTTFDYHFYFPSPGKYSHYPVHVAQNERLIAFAQPSTLNVVEKLTRIDRASWAYISQFGTPEEVFNYLKANNLHRLDLNKIAFRMADKAFFQKVTKLLAQRHAYNHTLWSYGIRHNSVPQVRQYLAHANGFVNQCGSYLESTLLSIDPVLRKTYEHMDYKPLVNARAHQLGRRRQILNDRFRQQYDRLLKTASYRRDLGDEELVAITYYLLLQDRVEEGSEFFSRVNPDRLHTRLQYEYFAAYFDFYSKDHEVARLIAEKHAEHPVDRWRKEFTNMVAQLDEIDGKDFVAANDDDRTQVQTRLASTDPNFDFQVEAKKVNINYQNIKQVQVNFYLMDVELLFSRNPFVQQFSGQFAYIRPNRTVTVKLSDKKATHSLALPEELHNSNVLVEIVGAGQRRTQAYYSNSLAVQVVENYGQVRVTRQQDRQPLSTVYVKVYAKMKDGTVKFYKDGYTDLRGRFDFTSLNTNELDFADSFSLLILSDDHGAVVREAKPPKQ